MFYSTEFFAWNVFENKILNRTGRWYLTVMNLTKLMSEDLLANGTEIPREMIVKFARGYGLRTWTSGCYYYNERDKAWVADGMEIRESRYGATYCRANHLTSFGTGFFVVPNLIDFDYVFANASFEDNLTIYIVIIITMIFYLILSMWSR